MSVDTDPTDFTLILTNQVSISQGKNAKAIPHVFLSVANARLHDYYFGK